jgi:hypothetical protein
LPTLTLLLEILLHPEEEAEWNEFCLSAKVIEHYDANHSVVYYKFVNSFPGSTAEVCAVRRTCVVEEGKHYILAYRAVEHSKVPIVSEIKRCGRHL